MVATECRAHEDIGAGDLAGSKSVVEFGRDTLRRSRHWARLAEARSGAVIAAGARELRNTRLNDGPGGCPIAPARVEHDGRGPLAETGEIEARAIAGGRDQSWTRIDVIAGRGRR